MISLTLNNTWLDNNWKCLSFSSFLESFILVFLFGNSGVFCFFCFLFLSDSRLLWKARTDWHPKSLNDTSCWQCMFAHTHRRSLSLLLPWTSLQGASILLTLSTTSTLKNLCMCHLPEHSQKPRAVLLLKISPAKVSVCLYYE